MQELCAQYAQQRVLLLGCRDVRTVARSYGLQKAFTALDLAADDPHRYPFLELPRVPLPEPREEPFKAVMVLHDPNQ
jgi:hypothetical protein